MNKLLILCCWIVLFGCEELDECRDRDARPFEVTVIDTEFCNLVLIEFKAEDLADVTRISGIESSRYYAFNLDNAIVTPGQRLQVEIRKTTDEEYVACPTFAPTYPSIVLVSLKILF
jgi:hypothetical protein